MTKQLVEFEKLSLIDEYKNSNFLNEVALVRLFKPILTELDEDGKTKKGIYLNESVIRFTSIVKIIKLGMRVSQDVKEFYPPDSLATVADILTQSRENPEYAIKLAKSKERFSGPNGIEKGAELEDLYNTPQYVNGFNEWLKYVFTKDKLTLTKDDMNTFLIPISFLQSKYTI